MNLHLLLRALTLMSCFIYLGFWLWAIWHAGSTPKAEPIQKLYWCLALFLNPPAVIWYWFIWKKWAFWLLFTPYFAITLAAPFMTRSFLTMHEVQVADSFIQALGKSGFLLFIALLLVYPMFVRFISILHLGQNHELTANDRNDWVISLAFPVFGFGASLFYCAKYHRAWAMVSLLWWGIMLASSRLILRVFLLNGSV